MKKFICLVFSMVFVLCFSVNVNAGDAIVSPLDLDSNNSTFIITSSGLACMSYYYRADTLTENVTVTITLEKKTLLFFWSDVETWTIQSNEANYGDEVTYQLTKGGTYRCTIVYEVTNTDGTTDTKEYQKEVEYDPA